MALLCRPIQPLNTPSSLTCSLGLQEECIAIVPEEEVLLGQSVDGGHLPPQAATEPCVLSALLTFTPSPSGTLFSKVLATSWGSSSPHAQFPPTQAPPPIVSLLQAFIDKFPD